MVSAVPPAPLPAGPGAPAAQALAGCCLGWRSSLVLYEHLHLVDEVPGDLQDLLGIVTLSSLCRKHGQLWECRSKGSGLGRAWGCPPTLCPPAGLLTSAYEEAGTSEPLQPCPGQERRHLSPVGGSQDGLDKLLPLKNLMMSVKSMLLSRMISR